MDATGDKLSGVQATCFGTRVSNAQVGDLCVPLKCCT
jgi:hypothetical protein